MSSVSMCFPQVHLVSCDLITGVPLVLRHVHSSGRLAIDEGADVLVAFVQFIYYSCDWGVGLVEEGEYIHMYVFNLLWERALSRWW